MNDYSSISCFNSLYASPLQEHNVKFVLAEKDKPSTLYQVEARIMRVAGNLFKELLMRPFCSKKNIIQLNSRVLDNILNFFAHGNLLNPNSEEIEVIHEVSDTYSISLLKNYMEMAYCFSPDLKLDVIAKKVLQNRLPISDKLQLAALDKDIHRFIDLAHELSKELSKKTMQEKVFRDCISESLVLFDWETYEKLMILIDSASVELYSLFTFVYFEQFSAAQLEVLYNQFKSMRLKITCLNYLSLEVKFRCIAKIKDENEKIKLVRHHLINRRMLVNELNQLEKWLDDINSSACWLMTIQALIFFGLKEQAQSFLPKLNSKEDHEVAQNMLEGISSPLPVDQASFILNEIENYTHFFVIQGLHKREYLRRNISFIQTLKVSFEKKFEYQTFNKNHLLYAIEVYIDQCVKAVNFSSQNIFHLFNPEDVSGMWKLRDENTMIKPLECALAYDFPLKDIEFLLSEKEIKKLAGAYLIAEVVKSSRRLQDWIDSTLPFE